MKRETGPTEAYLFRALFMDAMITNTGKTDPTAVLRVELIEVLYAPRIWHGVPSSVVSQTHLGW
jgi:hypothetical protein